MPRVWREIAAVSVCAACIAGCDSPKKEDEVPTQERFLEAIDGYESELDALKKVGNDAETAGKLPPADLEQRIAKTREELDAFLHRGTPTAVNWNATIKDLDRNGELVVAKTTYKDQHYELTIFDDHAKKNAEEHLVVGDEIKFSGSLGPERSVTQFGALLIAEFVLYPTAIRKGDVVITQPADAIVALLAAEARVATDGELGEQVKELCKQTVVENLSYPASASFGWFTDDLAKVSDTEWRYTGVIKASNEFGNKLPVRFSCSTVIDGEDMRATARFLD